jgi:enediyne polyketide synthase
LLVLMRDADAVAQGRFRYATIAGWGYSSDGKGGITRPEAGGHRLALKRAYAKAGFGIHTVGYLEGHGTGTAVGDATELRAFSEERREANPDAAPASISTVKGNIGHTKAAAGVAGLLKAILAVRHQVIPPATGHQDPHPELGGERPALRVPDAARLWPDGAPVRAGVSSMGFGGINAHVIVEHADGARRVTLGRGTVRLVRSRQDAEILLLDADGPADLRGRAAELAELSGRLSYAELGDLAATLESELGGRALRAAVVASSPKQAKERFTALLDLLDRGVRSALDTAQDVYLGSVSTSLRIGLLFPGQGAGRRADGGALRRRFESVDELYRAHPLPLGADLVATEIAQPRIATASAAGLRMLRALGIEAAGAAGHSLGELTALHWAGAVDEATFLELAAARGEVMAQASDAGGTMAGLAAAPEAVRPLLAATPVVIAGFNGPEQTVISGPADAVRAVGERAHRAGIEVSVIAVSHAFHSPLVAPAAVGLAGRLDGIGFAEPIGRVYSTVTGALLPADADLPQLLTRQVTAPVRFAEAVEALAAETDLLIEVGPGRILRSLAGQIAPAVPAVSMETDADSLSGLLRTVAAAYALGAPIRHRALFDGRYTRPFPLKKEFRFFASPCESAPEGDFVLENAVVGALTTVPTTIPAVASDGPRDTLEVLRRLAAQRAELPIEAVGIDSNPLDELHLSSITVGQIVNQAAQELGITAPLATSAYATSTLGELAGMLDELAETEHAEGERPQAAQGVAPWVRAFAIDHVPTPARAAVGNGGPAAAQGTWQVFAPEHHPLAPTLLRVLRRSGLGDGVLLCLPRSTEPEHVSLMLAAARAALSANGSARFVAVGDRRSAAGLAKTLHLELPSVATTVVGLPLPENLSDQRALAAAEQIAADVAATAGFAEVWYDAEGTRHEPVLRLLSPTEPTDAEPDYGLGPADVLLVTGGGKGITAECALWLGRRTGASVGLLGRSDPAEDTELAANLERMAAAGLRCHYVRADVTALDEVKSAVAEVGDKLGPITALLHGAGRNEPQALANLDEDAFKRTLAPKIAGLEAVLTAIDPANLRLLVGFGSIIGRAGLRGEADYSVANDWLTDLTRRVGAEYPECRCLSIEWSVWSGSGMGERLGVLESLMREGIDPIPTDEGVAMLGALLADRSTPDAVVVMGRAQGLPTITLEHRELPLLRFVDRPVVHYPGIELVVDADLSGASDLYLPDHLLDGDQLFPAVFGMEAMTQAAFALTDRSGTPVLEDVEFLRPIVVPVDGETTLRVAVLLDGPDTVRAVIRSGETGFQADHFRATLRYGVPLPDRANGANAHGARLPIEPADELYGPVLFQGTRFQRVLGYRELAATHCVAEISARASESWFTGFLPGDRLTGDPGARDAFMHAIQCCVPDATLLPAGVERLYLGRPRSFTRDTRLTLHARERSRDGDTYVYDLDVTDVSGALVERWEGLRLQAVRKLDGSGPWLPALLGPYLERRTEPNLGSALSVAVRPDDDTEAALRSLLGPGAVVRRRPDGKPEAGDGRHVSASHGAGVTFAVAAGVPVGCDVETVVERDETQWAGLLGEPGLALAGLLAAERGESLSLAGTRVWGAIECLRKNGRAVAELTLEPAGPDRWVWLRSGRARIAGFATTLQAVPEPVVFTMMAEGGA